MERNSTRRLGFSLFETLVTLVVLAALVALVGPALSQMAHRQRHQAQLQTLQADLQQARSMALSGLAPVRLRLEQLPDGSCYVVHRGPSGSCTCTEGGQAQCEPAGELLKTHWLPASSQLRIEGSVHQLVFHPRFGTASTAGTFAVLGPDNSKAALIVAITGRMRRCASANSGFGLPACV
ncbi:GspH/FimT family pseudopilin [Inhella proteolytica]|uniref:Type II secretion system protein H n=1 Tax=Inhella proteolytica TaxID=2795029 RepID=A0A931IZH8_9BURK|nr:GspH/FimT family protein [Inhella proteolytica]MBH9575591.1 GspH/FimT family protein [Inhella proteolytica]